MCRVLVYLENTPVASAPSLRRASYSAEKSAWLINSFVVNFSRTCRMRMYFKAHDFPISTKSIINAFAP